MKPIHPIQVVVRAGHGQDVGRLVHVLRRRRSSGDFFRAAAGHACSSGTSRDSRIPGTSIPREPSDQASDQIRQNPEHNPASNTLCRPQWRKHLVSGSRFASRSRLIYLYSQRGWCLLVHDGHRRLAGKKRTRGYHQNPAGPEGNRRYHQATYPVHEGQSIGRNRNRLVS